MISPGLTVIQKRVLDLLPTFGLPPGARILDAPCGSQAALALALQQKGFTATGADVDTAAAFLGDSFLPLDLNQPFPIAASSFDAVISTEGIEHLENHFSFLSELHRILRPGGVLILTTPNITALRSRVRFFGSGLLGRDHRPLNESARHPLHHISLVTFPWLRYELHMSGFRIRSVTHTHIKPISYAYAVYAPFMWLYTLIAFRKEKDSAQRARNREIRRALLSPSLLFGECLMVVAVKS